MKPTIIYDEPRPVTLGDLCEALAEGSVPARKEERFYIVSKTDVSRLSEALGAYERRRKQAIAESVTA